MGGRSKWGGNWIGKDAAAGGIGIKRCRCADGALPLDASAAVGGMVMLRLSVTFWCCSKLLRLVPGLKKNKKFRNEPTQV